MTMQLPESFTLPLGPDYDDQIESLHRDVIEEGGARLFLGMIRDGRRSWRTFHNETLMPISQLGLNVLESKNRDKTLVDPQHRTANAILSGAIFGNLANESLYPALNSKIYPYRKIFINESLLGPFDEAFKNAGEVRTEKGWQIGYQAMAAYVLRQLSDESIQHIDEWSQDVIQDTDYRPYFTEGVGLSLYAAWDHYGDHLMEQGRNDEVAANLDAAQSYRGGGTSI